MSIRDLCKNDTVYARVGGPAKNNGFYIHIDNVNDYHRALVYNCGTLVSGQRILVTISKISDDYEYILARVDSVCFDCDDRFCA